MIEVIIHTTDPAGRRREIRKKGTSQGSAIAAARGVIEGKGWVGFELVQARRLCKSLNVQESEYKVL